MNIVSMGSWWSAIWYGSLERIDSVGRADGLGRSLAFDWYGWESMNTTEI